MRENILRQLNMLDISTDTNRMLLSSMLYTIKSLRNSVAHNNIIFDTRFKDRKISTILKKWIEKETNISNITLYSLIDYIIVVCCILKRIDFSRIRATNLLEKYKEENQRLSSRVPINIYQTILQQNIANKISKLEIYLQS